jgi:hypothetical protein
MSLLIDVLSLALNFPFLKINFFAPSTIQGAAGFVPRQTALSGPWRKVK